MLEKLVAAAGDEFVKGYVRFRKIKECSGYKEIKRKASNHLSTVKYGRELADESVVAVVRFKWYLFLIFLATVMLLTLLVTSKAKGNPPEEIEDVFPLTKEESLPEIPLEEETIKYISVPGYSDLEIAEDTREIFVYNPDKNDCTMHFEFYIQEVLVATSRDLLPGESDFVDFYDKLEKNGQYNLKILCKSYGTRDNAEYNSVQQQVKLKVR